MNVILNNRAANPISFRGSLAHPLHQEIYGYWWDIAPIGELPGRQHIEPASIQELMPWLMLMDVVVSDAGPRFRFRLVGMRTAERFGKDATGLWLDDVTSGRQLQTVSDRFCTVVNTKAPIHYEDNSYAHGNEQVAIDTLALPLATDGQAVDMLMLVNVAPIT
jgi:hypothetical protein